MTDNWFRRRKEDAAWAEVGQFYETHKVNVLTSLSQQRKARTSLSAKAKGKQRATSTEPEDLEPWESELPEQFRGSKGYDVAKYLLQAKIEGVSEGDPRRKDLLYMVCINRYFIWKMLIHPFVRTRRIAYTLPSKLLMSLCK